MARQDDELDLFEAELLDALRDLARLPDAHRAYLSAGSRSCMPQVLRDPVTDYPGDETPRPPALGLAAMARLRLMVIGEGCLTSLIDPARMKLVGLVLELKGRQVKPEHFWQTVWQRMGGKRCGATTATLESRYRRQLVRMFDEWKRRQGPARVRAGMVLGEEVDMDALAALAAAIARVEALNARGGRIDPAEGAAALAALERAEAALAT